MKSCRRQCGDIYDRQINYFLEVVVLVARCKYTEIIHNHQWLESASQ